MRGFVKNITSVFCGVLLAGVVSFGFSSCLPLGTSIPGGITLGGGGGGSSGGGGGGGTPGAPTVSIPAPIVTRLTVSQPTGGVAVITGFPGCAVAGNIVEARNITKLKLRSSWEDIFIRSAQAAATVQTSANPDGSFSMQIDADKGDEIEVFQKDPSNTQSGPFVRVTSLYQPLSSSFKMTDVLVRSDIPDGDYFLIGEENGSGVAQPFSLGALPDLGSKFVMKDAVGNICTKPTVGTVEYANSSFGTNRLFVIDHDHQQFCVVPKDGSEGVAVDLAPHFPSAITNTIFQAAEDRVLITTDEFSVTPTIKIINTTNLRGLDLNLPSVPGSPKAVLASAVESFTTNGADIFAVVVVKYDNGLSYGFVVNLTPGRFGVGPGYLLANVETPIKLNLSQAYSAGEANLYLLDQSGKIHFIYVDTATNLVDSNFFINVGSDSVDVEYDGANGFALVSNKGDNSVNVVDMVGTGVGIVYTYVDLGAGPTKIGFDRFKGQFGIIQEVDNFFTVLEFISYPNDIIGLIMDPNGFTPSFLPKPVRKVPVLVKPFFAAFGASSSESQSSSRKTYQFLVRN